MNTQRFSSDIQQLIDDHQASLPSGDLQTIEILNELKDKALSLGDEELLGYVYHSLAFAHYFIASDYDAFIDNVRRAAKVLLGLEDQSELIHVYYLIAIDALNKGLYDLSYHYFSMAHNISLETQQVLSASILKVAMGQVLNLIGKHKQALTAFINGLNGIKREPSHPHFYNNITSCYMNMIHAQLELALFADAESAYEQVHAFVEDHTDIYQIDVQINSALVDGRIAIHKDDMERADAAVKRLAELLPNNVQIASYVPEISKLISELLEKHQLELAGIMIDALSKHGLSDEASLIQSMVIDTKIAYYQATDKREFLLESYLEQDKIQARIMIEQSEVNEYMQELLVLTNRLHIDQSNLHHEREELIRFAETDPLTNLANRYAGDHRFEVAFDRAFLRQQNLAVCLLDLDNLKECNDKHGHTAGDELLVDVAAALRQIMTHERVFCSRYGGDEFIILCENMSSADVESILSEIHHYTKADVSIGVCNTVPQAKMKTWDFLQAADRELYAIKDAKKAGDNTSSISITSKIVSFAERFNPNEPST